MSDPASYTVGWICAVETEYVAAQECLDAEHPRLDAQDPNDNNIYTLGSIGAHNIVIACLPHWNYGLVNAANVARDMLRTFPNVRFGLMVGIGGGVPTKQDVRLGDIVVSSLNYENGAVFQYNFGQTVQDKAFRTTGYLDAPPLLLQAAVQELKVRYRRHGNTIDKAINAILERNTRLRGEYRRPDPATDRLYKSTVVHRGASHESCVAVCGKEEVNLMVRTPRSEYEDNPKVHYGLIASADELMKDAMVRDRLAEEKGVLCFEMEAAGLMNHFKCLVIRGICDYADSHKNEKWQGYAAMAAAVYAKELLETIAPTKVATERKLGELLSEVDENLRGVHALASETRHEVEELKTDSHLEKIRSWLKPPNTSRNFNNARALRHENTGQWFLNSEAYLSWKKPYLKGAKGSNSFLWLNGIPGCGKTILSSSVVADLEQSAALSPSLIYFYFDFNDAEKQSLKNAVRSLVAQLYSKRREVRAEVDTLYSSCDKGARQPSIAELREVFGGTLQQAGETWIVLDALDECPTEDRSKDGLLLWIKGLRKSDLQIHILVTSRPETDIESAIKGWACDKEIILLQGQPAENDIKSYVQARTKQVQRWKDRQDIQQEVETALTENAHGMFRWVSCQFDSLDLCLDPKSVQEALANLPRTLDDTYARILKAVPPEHLLHAKRLLQFLTYSERPLRLEEAVDAVAVDTSSRPRFDTRNRMFVPEEVVKYCSSLVTLVRKDESGYKTARVEIQLAHFSVKQYLVSDRLEADIADDLKEIPARAAIVNVCLSYLLELDRSCGLQKAMETYHLAQYSAQYWAQHAAVVEKSGGQDLPIEEEYFASQGAFEFGSQLYSPDQWWRGHGKGIPVSCLYYAAFCGLARSTRMLLEKGAEVNAQGGYYGYALHAASSGGHKKIVQILLEKGAEVNTQSGYEGNALYTASSGGHEKIVQILLEKGAEVNAQGGYYGNALQAASSRGHEKIVQILLEKGAEVNAQGGDYGNALQAASFRGHEKVVQILLEKGAEVNTQSGGYGDALQVASSRGHEKVIQILLKKGAKVNTQSRYHGNALYAASSGGYEKVVQILLEKGAEVNAQGGDHGNALQAASFRGYEKVVQILLEKGAEMNIQSRYHGNALQAASFRGHEKVVQILLEKGAEVNAQGGRYGNALCAASFGGHEKVVQILLENGAEVNAQGGEYGNALQAASSKGYEKIVQILLKKGAEAQGGYYSNALYVASQYGDTAIDQRGQRHASAGVGRVGTPGPGLVLQESSSFVTGASGTRVASEASCPQEENESREAGAIDDHGKGIAKERKAQRKRKTPTSAEQPAPKRFTRSRANK